MKADKEKWIQEVMQSLEGAQPAEPGPLLYGRIMRRVQDQKTYTAPAALVWLAAASFATLLLLNIGMLRKQAAAAQPEAGQLAGRYHLLNNNTIAY